MTYDASDVRRELLRGSYVVADPVLWVPPTDLARPPQTQVRVFEAAPEDMAPVMRVTFNAVEVTLNVNRRGYGVIEPDPLWLPVGLPRTMRIEGMLDQATLYSEGMDALQDLHHAASIEVFLRVRRRYQHQDV